MTPGGPKYPKTGHIINTRALNLISSQKCSTVSQETKYGKTDDVMCGKRQTDPFFCQGLKYPKTGHIINIQALNLISSQKCSTLSQETKYDKTDDFVWGKRQTDPFFCQGSNYPKTGHIINMRALNLISSQKCSTLYQDTKCDKTDHFLWGKRQTDPFFARDQITH